ncbi:hypothetical protein IBX65_08225 [Candidatus Aerophobetes bacterium]|nr:hypothetical protein [Candidatus Aerophobetes bacterium]
MKKNKSVPIFCVIFLITTANSVFAHRVNIFAYMENDTVYTESYFADGTKVKAGIIQVYDSSGEILLEGNTDDNGWFHFKLPKKDDLNIILLAGMGHQASYILSRNELLESMPAGKLQEEKIKDVPTEQSLSLDTLKLKELIDASLDEKLRPVTRELIRMQQKRISLTDVIGGIGYIFGITGILFYLLSKKRS